MTSTEQTTVRKNIDDQKSRTRSSRPLLIFKHYPKAGGGSIKKLLKEFKPNLYEQYHEQLLCSNLQKTTSKGSNRTSEIEKQCEIYVDFNNTLVVIPELFPVLRSDHDQGFVISSMREPCDHYLSLWSYGSTKTGYMYNKSYQKRQNWTLQAYGKDPPKFDSARDIDAFKNIWLKDKAIKGLMSRRFIQSFGYEESPSSLEDISSVVDCWVYVDDFQASLYSCLRKYEDQGGYVNWDAPLLSKLVEQLQEKRTKRKLREHQEKNDPIGNPQLSHHSKCSMYFDQDAADMVRSGPDSIIYDIFGYQHCCGRARTFNNEVVFPPTAVLQDQHGSSPPDQLKFKPASPRHPGMNNNTEQNIIDHEGNLASPAFTDDTEEERFSPIWMPNEQKWMNRFRFFGVVCSFIIYGALFWKSRHRNKTKKFNLH